MSGQQVELQIPHRITGECGHKSYYWFLKIIIEFYMIALLAKRKKTRVGDILMVES